MQIFVYVLMTSIKGCLLEKFPELQCVLSVKCQMPQDYTGVEKETRPKN